MGQVNSCEYEALVAQGYSGEINRMRHDWDIDNNVEGHIAFYRALIAAGFTGAFPDMEQEFWCSGGTFVLQAIQGWTGFMDCGLEPITFNGEIVTHNGITVTI